MYKQKHTEVNMLDGPIFSTMVRFAIPVLFSSIFQQLYNTMDTVIVGHTLGETALAAIGAATPAYDLLMGFALGIGSGLSIVTARSYGSKDEETLKKSVCARDRSGADFDPDADDQNRPDAVSEAAQHTRRYSAGGLRVQLLHHAVYGCNFCI